MSTEFNQLWQHSLAVAAAAEKVTNATEIN
jgi:hypothetical protein